MRVALADTAGAAGHPVALWLHSVWPRFLCPQLKDSPQTIQGLSPQQRLALGRAIEQLAAAVEREDCWERSVWESRRLLTLTIHEAPYFHHTLSIPPEVIKAAWNPTVTAEFGC